MKKAISVYVIIELLLLNFGNEVQSHSSLKTGNNGVPEFNSNFTANHILPDTRKAPVLHLTATKSASTVKPNQVSITNATSSPSIKTIRRSNIFSRHWFANHLKTPHTFPKLFKRSGLRITRPFKLQRASTPIRYNSRSTVKYSFAMKPFYVANRRKKSLVKSPPANLKLNAFSSTLRPVTSSLMIQHIPSIKKIVQVQRKAVIVSSRRNKIKLLMTTSTTEPGRARTIKNSLARKPMHKLRRRKKSVSKVALAHSKWNTSISTIIQNIRSVERTKQLHKTLSLTQKPMQLARRRGYSSSSTTISGHSSLVKYKSDTIKTNSAIKPERPNHPTRRTSKIGYSSIEPFQASASSSSSSSIKGRRLSTIKYKWFMDASRTPLPLSSTMGRRLSTIQSIPATKSSVPPDDGNKYNSSNKQTSLLPSSVSDVSGTTKYHQSMKPITRVELSSTSVKYKEITAITNNSTTKLTQTSRSIKPDISTTSKYSTAMTPVEKARRIENVSATPLLTTLVTYKRENVTKNTFGITRKKPDNVTGKINQLGVPDKSSGTNTRNSTDGTSHLTGRVEQLWSPTTNSLTSSSIKPDLSTTSKYSSAMTPVKIAKRREKLSVSSANPLLTTLVPYEKANVTKNTFVITLKEPDHVTGKSNQFGAPDKSSETNTPNSTNGASHRNRKVEQLWSPSINSVTLNSINRAVSSTSSLSITSIPIVVKIDYFISSTTTSWPTRLVKHEGSSTFQNGSVTKSMQQTHLNRRKGRSSSTFSSISTSTKPEELTATNSSVMKAAQTGVRIEYLNSSSMTLGPPILVSQPITHSSTINSTQSKYLSGRISKLKTLSYRQVNDMLNNTKYSSAIRSTQSTTPVNSIRKFGIFTARKRAQFRSSTTALPNSHIVKADELSTITHSSVIKSTQSKPPTRRTSKFKIVLGRTAVKFRSSSTTAVPPHLFTTNISSDNKHSSVITPTQSKPPTRRTRKFRIAKGRTAVKFRTSSTTVLPSHLVSSANKNSSVIKRRYTKHLTKRISNHTLRARKAPMFRPSSTLLPSSLVKADTSSTIKHSSAIKPTYSKRQIRRSSTWAARKAEKVRPTSTISSPLRLLKTDISSTMKHSSAIKPTYSKRQIRRSSTSAARKAEKVRPTSTISSPLRLLKTDISSTMKHSSAIKPTYSKRQIRRSSTSAARKAEKVRPTSTISSPLRLLKTDISSTIKHSSAIKPTYSKRQIRRSSTSAARKAEKVRPTSTISSPLRLLKTDISSTMKHSSAIKPTYSKRQIRRSSTWAARKAETVRPTSTISSPLRLLKTDISSTMKHSSAIKPTYSKRQIRRSSTSAARKAEKVRPTSTISSPLRLLKTDISSTMKHSSAIKPTYSKRQIRRSSTAAARKAEKVRPTSTISSPLRLLKTDISSTIKHSSAIKPTYSKRQIRRSSTSAARKAEKVRPTSTISSPLRLLKTDISSTMKHSSAIKPTYSKRQIRRSSTWAARKAEKVRPTSTISPPLRLLKTDISSTVKHSSAIKPTYSKRQIRRSSTWAARKAEKVRPTSTISPPLRLLKTDISSTVKHSSAIKPTYSKRHIRRSSTSAARKAEKVRPTSTISPPLRLLKTDISSTVKHSSAIKPNYSKRQIRRSSTWAARKAEKVRPTSTISPPLRLLKTDISSTVKHSSAIKPTYSKRQIRRSSTWAARKAEKVRPTSTISPPLRLLKTDISSTVKHSSAIKPTYSKRQIRRSSTWAARKAEKVRPTSAISPPLRLLKTDISSTVKHSSAIKPTYSKRQIRRSSTWAARKAEKIRPTSTISPPLRLLKTDISSTVKHSSAIKPTYSKRQIRRSSTWAARKAETVRPTSTISPPLRLLKTDISSTIKHSSANKQIQATRRMGRFNTRSTTSWSSILVRRTTNHSVDIIPTQRRKASISKSNTSSVRQVRKFRPRSTTSLPSSVADADIASRVKHSLAIDAFPIAKGMGDFDSEGTSPKKFRLQTASTLDFTRTSILKYSAAVKPTQVVEMRKFSSSVKPFGSSTAKYSSERNAVTTKMKSTFSLHNITSSAAKYGSVTRSNSLTEGRRYFNIIIKSNPLQTTIMYKSNIRPTDSPLKNKKFNVSVQAIELRNDPSTESVRLAALIRHSNLSLEAFTARSVAYSPTIKSNNVIIKSLKKVDTSESPITSNVPKYRAVINPTGVPRRLKEFTSSKSNDLSTIEFSSTIKLTHLARRLVRRKPLSVAPLTEEITVQSVVSVDPIAVTDRSIKYRSALKPALLSRRKLNTSIQPFASIRRRYSSATKSVPSRRRNGFSSSVKPLRPSTIKYNNPLNILRPASKRGAFSSAMERAGSTTSTYEEGMKIVRLHTSGNKFDNKRFSIRSGTVPYNNGSYFDV